MSKVMAASAMVLGGGGMAVTTTYMMGAFNGLIKPLDASIAEDLVAFKGTDGGHCVQSLFPGLTKESMKGATDISSSVADWEEGKNSETSGCLVVNWEKDVYANNKGKDGKFRFLWAAQQSKTKGFIVFAAAKTSTTTPTSLTWEGIAYSLTKGESEGTTGTISKKEGSAKTMDKSSLKTKFPKAGGSFYKSKPFGGFIEDENGMDSFCSSTDPNVCTGTRTSQDSFKGYGAGQGSSEESKNKKLKEWTDSLSSDENGWKEIFDVTNWNMKDFVKDALVGEGTQRFLFEPESFKG